MNFDYEGRIRRLREMMGGTGVDAVLLSIGPDLPYLTGFEAHPSERLTMGVVTLEDAVLFVPRLEAPKVPPGPLTVSAWDETDDPISKVVSLLGRSETLAVGEQTWSRFTLALQDRLPTREWMGASTVIGPLRIRKEALELDALAEVARQADEVARRIPEEVQFAGSTEMAVSVQIKQLLLDQGHDEALFSIVASGPNGASPHHDAEDRVIEAGELVVCDFGGSWRGYRSDTTRTFSVGAPSHRQREVHEAVRIAQEAGRKSVAPGVECQQVDRVVRGVIADAGFGEWFVHRTGHGIGLDVHEEPYLVEGNALQLEPGMAFSIEPGIYLPGEFGVRIEDIVICGEDGPVTLNNSTRALVEVA